MLKDPVAFVDDHITQSRKDLKSFATDEGCGGYSGGWIYKMDFGDWHEFRVPDIQGRLKKPWILANTPVLADATRIAVDTRVPTGEVFLMFDIGLADIPVGKPPGAQAFQPIDWPSIEVEKK